MTTRYDDDRNYDILGTCLSLTVNIQPARLRVNKIPVGSPPPFYRRYGAGILPLARASAAVW